MDYDISVAAEELIRQWIAEKQLQDIQVLAKVEGVREFIAKVSNDIKKYEDECRAREAAGSEIERRESVELPSAESTEAPQAD